MPFHCGIIGLPNAGKTTICNALTAGRAEVAPSAPPGKTWGRPGAGRKTPSLGGLEVELQDFSPGERREFPAGLGLTASGSARLVRESLWLLGLVTF